MRKTNKSYTDEKEKRKEKGWKEGRKEEVGTEGGWKTVSFYMGHDYPQ